MQQAELITILEEIAPPAFAAPWDKSGIQAASSRAEIGHLAVSLDPTPDTVRQALSVGADMLLTHHPLTLEPRFPDRLDAYHETLSLLLPARMPHYAAHTSLDANPEGPAAWLADELGLTGRVLLEPTGSALSAGRELQGGIGCVGDLPAPLALPELIGRLRALLPHLHCARLIGTPPPAVRRLAVCPGSGSSLADEALRLGADIFITGDVKYHTALDLGDQIQSLGAPFAILDVGHFSLEEEMTRRLALLLEKRLPGVRITFLPGRDPFHPLFPEAPEVPL